MLDFVGAEDPSNAVVGRHPTPEEEYPHAGDERPHIAIRGIAVGVRRVRLSERLRDA